MYKRNSPEKSRVGKARNNGVLASSGKYITFVDSDDYLPDDPTIYSKAISILENHDVDIVTWLWQFQNEGGKIDNRST